MRFLAAKHLGSLRPVDDAGQEAIAKIGNGEVVEIELRRPRNIRFHRLYFALVNLIWNNMDHARYPSIEDLHGALKIAAGLRTRIELPDGTVGFMPGSIAFHRMDETAFGQFYDKIADLVAAKFLPGVTATDLKAEVETMIGIRK